MGGVVSLRERGVDDLISIILKIKNNSHFKSSSDTSEYLVSIKVQIKTHYSFLYQYIILKLNLAP